MRLTDAFTEYSHSPCSTVIGRLPNFPDDVQVLRVLFRSSEYWWSWLDATSIQCIYNQQWSNRLGSFRRISPVVRFVIGLKSKRIGKLLKMRCYFKNLISKRVLHEFSKFFRCSDWESQWEDHKPSQSDGIADVRWMPFGLRISVARLTSAIEAGRRLDDARIGENHFWQPQTEAL